MVEDLRPRGVANHVTWQRPYGPVSVIGSPMDHGDDVIHFEGEMTVLLWQEAIFANAACPVPNQLEKVVIHALGLHRTDFKDFAALAESKPRKRPIRT